MTPVKHTPVSHSAKPAKPAKPTVKKEQYIETIGRRKTAGARVRVYGNAKGAEIVINKRSFAEYFPVKKHQSVVVAPFATLSVTEYKVTAHVTGGGTAAQAEAVRLGIARALVAETPETRSRLKALGYLKRDPRMVERKKPGSRKARRPQQWRKR
ncbi:MAG: 30S ribosomal protein S9 [Patescibacteria group bacterium]